ncbi:pre-peptidase C-terminal domain-containing protein [Anaerosporobacter faecicola]|uniref:pre-peptidase C-terminal domain-containing protein n=1 Tax=Anaerosporobacter faecicola TaxID=2718714 RepID=UPI00143C1456|nr:pre-peptidase C-terminal domain-containing protein [Anaerosporobacter faecicola]
MNKSRKTFASTLICVMLVVSMLFGESISKAATILDTENNPKTELTTTTITTGTDEDFANFTTNVIQTTMENEVVPLKIDQKGCLNYIVATNLTSGADVGVFSDEGCTTKVGNQLYISTYSDVISEGVYAEQGEAYFTKAGTYYVKFSDPGTYTFSSQLYNGANRTIKNNTYTTSYGYKYDTYNYDSKNIYYKYKASKTGYITITAEFQETYGNAYITLCNSKKKAITDDAYLSTSSTSQKVVFAVKKGTTYNIKVSTTSGLYRVKSKITGVSESSGAKKAKAKALTFKKERKGIVLAEDKTSKYDYYKFTLTKASKIHMDIKGNVSSGKICVELTGTNIAGALTKYISTTDYSYSSSVETYTSSKLPKGTYYVKVYKDSKKTSGTYSIKFTKK